MNKFKIKYLNTYRGVLYDFVVCDTYNSAFGNIFIILFLSFSQCKGIHINVHVKMAFSF